MSTLRIEFVKFGSGAGMDAAGSGILKEVVSAVEVEADGTATVDEDLIAVPSGATGVVLIGVVGNTYVRVSKPRIVDDESVPLADPAATLENSKLVTEGQEVGWSTVAGRYISVLERA